MKYRVINARTREPIGGDFEAPNISAAKVVGAMREDSMTRVIVFELPPEAKPVPMVLANMPITNVNDPAPEDDRASPAYVNRMAMGVDMAVPGSDETVINFPLAEVERALAHWLNYSRFRPQGLPEGYRLVPHVHRGPRENLIGRWEVSLVLVSEEPAKRAPENGSSPGLPEGASRKDAG